MSTSDNRAPPDKGKATPRSALAILRASAQQNSRARFLAQGVCPQVLVSIHEDQCAECERYALHVSNDVVGSTTTNASTSYEELYEALGTLFPEHRARLEHAQEVESLQTELQKRDERIKNLRKKVEDLKLDLEDARDRIEVADRDAAHFHTEFENAKQHYLALRDFTSHVAWGIPVPSNAYPDERRASSSQKRHREDSPPPKTGSSHAPSVTSPEK